MNNDEIVASMLSKYSQHKLNQYVENLILNPLAEYPAKKLLWYFFIRERMATRNRGVNFYEFYREFSTKHIYIPMIQNMILTCNYDDTPAHIFKLYRLKYSSIPVFKISTTINILEKFPQIRTVLDPCAGWAGRMLGSILSGKKYIGFDTNVNLREPYTKILEYFPNHNAVVEFVDSQTVDFTRYTYDCVFTSPPYYNIELYSYCSKRSKLEWNNWYRLLFTKLFNGLENLGLLILSINPQMYDFFKTFLGECSQQLELNLGSNRNKSNPYCEWVYIWKKSICQEFAHNDLERLLNASY